MIKRQIELPIAEIYEECLNSCISFCGIQKDTARGQKILKACIETREKFCRDVKLKILITPFEGKCVTEEGFLIGENKICCKDLKKQLPSTVTGGYAYVVFADEIRPEGMNTLQAYYADCWMSAYVDAGFRSLKTILKKEAVKDFCPESGEKAEITVFDSFAPGFYGMPPKCTCDLFGLLELSGLGMELTPDNLIIPQKSIIGIYPVAAAL